MSASSNSPVLNGLIGQRVNIAYKFPMPSNGGFGFPGTAGTVLAVDDTVISIQSTDGRKIVPLSEVQYIDVVDSIKGGGGLVLPTIQRS